MKITTVNFKPDLVSERNVEQIMEILRSHADSDMVVFPEASLQGYMPFLEDRSIRYYLESAVDLGKESIFLEAIKNIAAANNQVVVIGLIERDDEHGHGHLFDSALVVLPDKNHHVYRKTHLATNEPYFLFPGDSLDVLETPVGKMGLLICYDKCFCETARTLAIKGADIIVILSAWAYSKAGQSEEEKELDHSKKVFDVYDQVRAVENQCLVVVSNQVGVNDDNSLEFLGSSKIVAPNGKIIGQLDDRPGELTAEVNLAESLIEERLLNLCALNIIRNRRPDIYI